MQSHGIAGFEFKLSIVIEDVVATCMMLLYDIMYTKLSNEMSNFTFVDIETLLMVRYNYIYFSIHYIKSLTCNMSI